MVLTLSSTAGMNASASPNLTASVLVVDDTPNNLRLLSELLNDHGYEVRAVIDGTMAIKAAQMRPPDIILLDIKMPGMDGYEVCAHLKRDPRTADTPVIFLSAFNESIDRARAFQAGGVDYLNKPIQIEEVLSRLDIHLGRQFWQRQARQAQAALRAIQRLHTQPGATFAAHCALSLQVGCEVLGATTGWVSGILGDRVVIQAVQGGAEFWGDAAAETQGKPQELALAETPERLVWETQQTQCIAPLSSEAALAALPGVQALKPQAYGGTPLNPGGQRYGTVSFFCPRPHLPETAPELLALIAASFNARLLLGP